MGKTANTRSNDGLTPNRQYPINSKWGESCVGLQMAVPLSWWSNYSNNDIYLGNIAKADPSASPFSVLEIDDELGNF